MTLLGIQHDLRTCQDRKGAASNPRLARPPSRQHGFRGCRFARFVIALVLDMPWSMSLSVTLNTEWVIEYFSPSWTAFQADRGRDFSVIVDGVSV